jgi:hypothetical protein
MVALRDVAELAGGTGGPYFIIASQLDLLDLCQLDTTCGMLRAMHSPSVWKAAGEASFLAIELAGWNRRVGSEPFIRRTTMKLRHQVNPEVNWKTRCRFFHAQLQTFSMKTFSMNIGRQISTVRLDDELAYCRCILQTGVLAQHAGISVYVEFNVIRNDDNLSLALVDSPGAGKNFTSVTFSPELGAVIIERQNVAVPGGNSAHFLPAAPGGHKFEGKMGIYVKDGRVAFFRRWAQHSLDALRNLAAVGTDHAPIDKLWHLATQEDYDLAFWTEHADVEEGGAHADTMECIASAHADSMECIASAGGLTGEPAWETTGFCTTLWWARSQRLSICIAFRDKGEYDLHTSKVGRQPPIIFDERLRVPGLVSHFV